MPHAILRVSSRYILMGKGGDPWSSTIKNIHGTIPNPDPPSHQVVRNMYTNSEFPCMLDDAIVRRIKALKNDNNGVISIDGDDMNVTSIKEIGLSILYPKYKQGPLDNIHVSLPLMLDWLEELGWEVILVTKEHNSCDYTLRSKLTGLSG